MTILMKLHFSIFCRVSICSFVVHAFSISSLQSRSSIPTKATNNPLIGNRNGGQERFGFGIRINALRNGLFNRKIDLHFENSNGSNFKQSSLQQNSTTPSLSSFSSASTILSPERTYASEAQQEQQQQQQQQPEINVQKLPTLEEYEKSKLDIQLVLLDNYDSYTYNIYSYLCTMCKHEPIVIPNNKFETWDDLVESVSDQISRSIDGIVISPGPGRPECRNDMGICLEVRNELFVVPYSS